MTYDWEADALGSWSLATACLRAQHLAGRKLTPKEMLVMVDRPETVEITAEKLASMLERPLLCDGIIKSGEAWKLKVTGKVLVEILERAK